MLCDTKVKISPYDHVNRIAPKRPGSLLVLDVAANETSAIEVPFFGHTADQHPQLPSHVVSFEKWGAQGGLIDISAKKLVEIYDPKKGYRFYGHALFNTDGSLLVNTEYDLEQGSGILTLRNMSDKKIIGDYSSYGDMPHGCCTPDNGKTIVVTNGGSKVSAPNVSWIDYASGKLLRQVVLDKSSEVGYGHIAMSHDGWFCVCGSNRDESTKSTFDLIVFISPDGKVHIPEVSQDLKRRMQNEALSIAFLGKSGLVSVTIPNSDLVLIIDYKTQKIIEAIDLEKPKGTVQNLDTHHDRPTILTSMAKDKKLVSIGVHPGNTHPPVQNINNSFGGLGSHMTRVYL